METGERVSNAYAIYLWFGNNTSNEVLIPDDAAAPHGDLLLKLRRLETSMRPIRFGKVTAYQAFDG